MTEANRNVLGLPFMRVYKFHMKITNHLEKWLESKGLTVLDTGRDDRGEYFIVSTNDRELAKAIEERITQRA